MAAPWAFSGARPAGRKRSLGWDGRGGEDGGEGRDRPEAAWGHLQWRGRSAKKKHRSSSLTPAGRKPILRIKSFAPSFSRLRIMSVKAHEMSGPGPANARSGAVVNTRRPCTSEGDMPRPASLQAPAGGSAHSRAERRKADPPLQPGSVPAPCADTAAARAPCLRATAGAGCCRSGWLHRRRHGTKGSLLCAGQLAPAAALWAWFVALLLLSDGMMLRAESELAGPVGFRLRGDAVNWYPDAPGLGTNRWRFEVGALGVHWQITVWRQDGIRLTFGGDNRDVYSLIAPPRNAPGKTGGMVFPGPYPVQSPGISVALAWVGYCSAVHFSNELSRAADRTCRLPRPWRSPGADPMAHIYRAKVDLLAGPGSLPRRVEYWPDQDAIQSILDGSFPGLARMTKEQRDEAVIRARTYYSRIHEPEAVYSAGETTNLHGWLVPLSFSYRSYHFHFPKSSDRVVKRVFSEARAVASQVESIRKLVWLPQADPGTGSFNVADYRFADAEKNIGFISYRIGDNRWITNRDDRRLQRLVAAERALKMKWLYRVRFNPYFVCAVFVATVALPLLSRTVRQWLFQALRKPFR